MLPFPPLERRSAPTPAPFMDVARAIDGQHAWLGCEVFFAAKTKPRAPNAALAFLRCARYRVPARPRPRAPRSVGPRGALRRLRRLGWRPRRPGARQPRCERVAGGRRGKLRAGRPSLREPSAGEGARCPARATGATAAAARSDAPAPVASSRGRRTGRRFFRANAQPSGRVRTN